MTTTATAPTSDATAEQRTLRLTQVLKASPERAFAAWVDPKALAQWWGPEGFTCGECEMTVRVGGAYRTVMISPTGSRHEASGVYREIAPPDRLEFTWAWTQEDGTRGHETVVTLAFAPHPAGTEMTMIQRLFQDVDARDKHEQGWTSTLRCLAAFVEGGA